MGSYYLILGVVALVSWLVSSTLKRKFATYSKIHLRNGLSGAEIAEKMLLDHGINLPHIRLQQVFFIFFQLEN